MNGDNPFLPDAPLGNGQTERVYADGTWQRKVMDVAAKQSREKAWEGVEAVALLGILYSEAHTYLDERQHFICATSFVGGWYSRAHIQIGKAQITEVELPPRRVQP